MYSQALRVKRVCFEEEDFEQHILEMRSWFQKRAYPIKTLDEELVKFRLFNQAKTCSRKGKGTPFVVIFRVVRKLCAYLVKAKVYPLERKIGSCGYGKKRCQVCLNVTETDSFTSILPLRHIK